MTRQNLVGISNLTSVFLEDVEIAVLLGHVQGYT